MLCLRFGLTLLKVQRNPIPGSMGPNVLGPPNPLGPNGAGPGPNGSKRCQNLRPVPPNEEDGPHIYAYIYIYMADRKTPLLSVTTGWHSDRSRRSENIAFRLHRGRSAEDPRGSQGSEGTGWAPSDGMIEFPFRGRRAPGEVIDFSFYLHRRRSAEDPRKTPRGRPLRKTPRGTPTHRLNRYPTLSMRYILSSEFVIVLKYAVFNWWVLG